MMVDLGWPKEEMDQSKWSPTVASHPFLRKVLEKERDAHPLETKNAKTESHRDVPGIGK
jgi:hypothetical protein